MKVISELDLPDGSKWYSFYCPGCEHSHHFTPSWQFNGDYEKPTVSPSILVNKGRANPTAHVCHMFIREGMIQYLDDCTHKLAGQTVAMEKE
jgi:hypothetical protein